MRYIFAILLSLWAGLVHAQILTTGVGPGSMGGAGGGGGITSFTATGPSTGTAGSASTNFTVTAVGGTFSGTDTITIADGTKGGTLTPSVGSPGTSTVTVTPTAASSSFTFTYTAVIGDAVTLTFTNAQAWSNPATLPYLGAVTYTGTGPSTGTVGSASTNFTVTMPASVHFTGADTVTIADASGGGTFTPSVGSPGTSTVTVTPANNATSFTFTYNAASAGAKTLTFTNAQSWTNPSPLTYTASAAATETLNPSDKGANITLSGGNLIAVNASNAGGLYDAARSITSHTTGKYYFEVTITANNANNFTIAIGICNASMLVTAGNPGTDANLSISEYQGNTSLKLNNANTGTVPVLSGGIPRKVAVAVDVGAKLIWISGDGATWNAVTSVDPAAGTGGISFSAITGPYFVFLGLFRFTNIGATINFGGSAYNFTPPTGFGNW